MTLAKRLSALLAVPALAVVAALPAQAAEPTNDITVQKSCTASDVTFEARAEWKYTYVVGGVTKAKIDRLEWSIQDQADPDGIGPLLTSPQGVDPQYGEDDTTDYTFKSYSNYNLKQVLVGDDVEVLYSNDGDNGELWKGRNPANPTVQAGSRITASLGVNEDGLPNCKVTFRVPSALGPELPE